jgi:hypothetical protein
MKTEAWGWLAAGVVALGLNGFYQDSGFARAHRAVDRIESSSAAVLALATGRADHVFSEARLVTVRQETAPCRFGTALAQVETKIARTQTAVGRWEAMSVRQEAQFARLESARARREAVQVRLACSRVPAVTVNPVVLKEIRIEACPRVHVNMPRMPRISVPKVSIPEITIPRVDIPKISVPAVPVIHIEMPDAGPV